MDLRNLARFEKDGSPGAHPTPDGVIAFLVRGFELKVERIRRRHGERGSSVPTALVRVPNGPAERSQAGFAACYSCSRSSIVRLAHLPDSSLKMCSAPGPSTITQRRSTLTCTGVLSATGSVAHVPVFALNAYTADEV